MRPRTSLYRPSSRQTGRQPSPAFPRRIARAGWACSSQGEPQARPPRRWRRLASSRRSVDFPLLRMAAARTRRRRVADFPSAFPAFDQGHDHLPAHRPNQFCSQKSSIASKVAMPESSARRRVADVRAATAPLSYRCLKIARNFMELRPGRVPLCERGGRPSWTRRFARRIAATTTAATGSGSEGVVMSGVGGAMCWGCDRVGNRCGDVVVTVSPLSEA